MALADEGRCVVAEHALMKGLIGEARRLLEVFLRSGGVWQLAADWSGLPPRMKMLKLQRRRCSRQVMHRAPAGGNAPAVS